MGGKITKTLSFVLVAAAAIGMAASGIFSAPAWAKSGGKEYPSQAITAVSTFSATSGTFSDALKICGIAEQILGSNITVVDHGGGGAVGTDFVYNSKPDGYTLLCGTDSVSLFGVMEVSDITYDDFMPICLAYGKVFYLVGNKDSKYSCLQDLIDDAKANPKRVTVATTGVGTVPDVWFSLLSDYFDVEFNVVKYEGNGDALTALMGGHVDAFITNTQQSLSYVESGDIKPITLFFDHDIPQLVGTEKISESFPDLARYSGFGNFFQVSVHKDTPPEIVEKLTDVFMQAYNSEAFQKYIKESGHLPLGLTGKEAIEYEKRSQSIGCYIMFDSGATNINPADLGVNRITE